MLDKPEFERDSSDAIHLESVGGAVEELARHGRLHVEQTQLSKAEVTPDSGSESKEFAGDDSPTGGRIGPAD